VISTNPSAEVPSFDADEPRHRLLTHHDGVAAFGEREHCLDLDSTHVLGLGNGHEHVHRAAVSTLDIAFGSLAP
jgi:hypothetical protein